jgi:hypothetical protein
VYTYEVKNSNKHHRRHKKKTPIIKAQAEHKEKNKTIKNRNLEKPCGVVLR